MSEIKKVKMVFIGGKNAPSSYKSGEVYELSETHLKFPWFIDAPEDAKIGDKIDIHLESSRTASKVIPKTKVLVIPPGLKGDFKMQFVGGKSAPATFGFKGQNYKLEKGMIFELPANYARYPWWNLLDPLPEILIPDIEADTIYEESVFIPPEVVDVSPLVEVGLEAEDQTKPSDEEEVPDTIPASIPSEEVPLSEDQLNAMRKEDIKREMRDRGIAYERFDTKDDLIQKVLKHYAPA